MPSTVTVRVCAPGASPPKTRLRGQALRPYVSMTPCDAPSMKTSTWPALTAARYPRLAQVPVKVRLRVSLATDEAAYQPALALAWALSVQEVFVAVKGAPL